MKWFWKISRKERQGGDTRKKGKEEKKDKRKGQKEEERKKEEKEKEGKKKKICLVRDSIQRHPLNVRHQVPYRIYTTKSG